MSANRHSPRARRRPGGPRRWTAADKTAYLAAFATSGQTIQLFCDATGVPRATFNLWQREARDVRRAQAARRLSGTPAFARVELARPSASREITMLVRRPGALEAELSGLDAATVVTVLLGVLRAEAR